MMQFRRRARNETIAPPVADEDSSETAESILIERAVAGDLTAFNQIVELYQSAVLTHCTAILRDPSLAEDVAQESMVKAWRSISGFRGESIRSWLMRIATNSCLDLIRQRARQATDSLDAQLTEPTPIWSTQSHDFSPEERSEQAELSDRLGAALARLPEEQRVALLMSDALGYEYHEIAEITDSAIGTIKSRISRGRARLRAELLADEQSREHFERYDRS